MITRVKFENYHWYWLAAITSILLSVWLNYAETVINPDGICYLMSAELFGTAGLHEATHFCPQAQWPFYSALIFVASKFLPLSSMMTAYLIDGIFSLMSVILFLSIIRELGATPRILGFAALTILLSHDFNAVRQYIIRDHGFWAFYLASVWCLLLYFREPNWRMALAWSGSLVVATLFRIEGGVFLVLCPFLTLLHHRFSFAERVKHFFQLNLLVIIAMAVMALWFVSHSQASLEKMGRIHELFLQFTHGFAIMLNRFYALTQAMVQHVLPAEAARDAASVLAITYIIWYLFNVINNASFIAILLVLYTWVTSAAIWTRSSRLVVWGYLAVNFIITAGFFAEHQFLSKRYLIAMTLVLLLWVPYGLDKLWQKSNKQPYAKLFKAVMLLILISALGGVFEFGYSKRYIHDAGDWLATSVAFDKKLYVNDLQLMYYSKHFQDDIYRKMSVYQNNAAITDGSWVHYDYLAMRLNKETRPVIEQQLGFPPDKVFQNKRGDQIAIFNVRRQPS